MELLSPFIVPSIVNLGQKLAYGWQLKGTEQWKIESLIIVDICANDTTDFFEEVSAHTFYKLVSSLF